MERLNTVEYIAFFEGNASVKELEKIRFFLKQEVEVRYPENKPDLQVKRSSENAFEFSLVATRSGFTGNEDIDFIKMVVSHLNRQRVGFDETRIGLNRIDRVSQKIILNMDMISHQN